MKIQEALELAKTCELETVGEAILNVKMHANSLFAYSEMQKELEELNNTWDWIKSHRRTPDGKGVIDEETKVQLMLDYNIAKDLVDYDMYQSALKVPSFAQRLGNE